MTNFCRKFDFFSTKGWFMTAASTARSRRDAAVLCCLWSYICRINIYKRNIIIFLKINYVSTPMHLHKHLHRTIHVIALVRESIFVIDAKKIYVLLSLFLSQWSLAVILQNDNATRTRNWYLRSGLSIYWIYILLSF